MNDLTLGNMMLASWIILGIEFVVFAVYLIAKEKLTKSRFLRFLGILLIGAVSSMVPMGPFGLIVGAPSVFLAAVLVSLLLDKESI